MSIIPNRFHDVYFPNDHMMIRSETWNADGMIIWSSEINKNIKVYYKINPLIERNEDKP